MTHYSLQIDEHDVISLFKYAVDLTLLVTIARLGLPERSADVALSNFMDWTGANGMQCGVTLLISKFKELLLHKNRKATAYPVSQYNLAV